MSSNKTPNTTLGYGMLLGCIAAFLLVTMDTISKWLSGFGFSVWLITWARFAAPQVVMGGFFTARNGLGVWQSKAPWLQAARSTSLATATLCLFGAVAQISLTTNVMIFYLNIFIVAILAIPMLNERMNWLQWACSFAGFSGVILALGPESLAEDIRWPLLLAFGAATFAGLYTLFTRMAGKYDSIETSQVYTTLSGSVLFLPFAMMNLPSEIAWGLIAVLATFGLLGGVAHLLMITALSFSPAPFISMAYYSNIIWIVLYDTLLFNQAPSVQALIGCCIVILAGLVFLRAPKVPR